MTTTRRVQHKPPISGRVIRPPEQFALRTLACALSLFLSGCAVGPDFATPETPPVTSYTAAQDVSSETRAGDAEQQFSTVDIPAQWWALFHSTTLDQWVKTAMTDSPTLDAARARLRQAQEDLNAQTGARTLPSIDGKLSGARQKVDPAAFGVPVAEQPPPFTLYNASVSVSYTLDIFGANQRALEGLKAEVDNQAHELQAARMTLAANVVTTAIRQAAAREKIDTTLALFAAQSEQLRIMQARLHAGGVSQADVSNQQLLLAQTRATLPPLEAQFSQLSHQLAVYLGQPPSLLPITPLRLADLQLPADVPVGIPSQLTRQRPDILAAEALWHKASADVGVATANLYPQFTLTGSFGSQRTNAGDLSQGLNVWNLGLGLVQPLFHGGELQALKRSAEAAYDAAAAQYRQTVLQGFQQVADALRSLQTDAQSVNARQDAAQQAQAALDIARARYQSGGISHLSLLDSQRQQLQTHVDSIGAQADQYADTAALLHAVGGGWWNEPDVPPTPASP